MSKIRMIDYALEKSVELLNEEMVKLDNATEEYAKSPTPENRSWLHLQIMNVQSMRLQVAQLKRIIKLRVAEHGS